MARPEEPNSLLVLRYKCSTSSASHLKDEPEKGTGNPEAYPCGCCNQDPLWISGMGVMGGELGDEGGEVLGVLLSTLSWCFFTAVL